MSFILGQRSRINKQNIFYNNSVNLTAFRRKLLQPLDTRTKKKTGIESQGKSVDRSVQKLAF